MKAEEFIAWSGRRAVAPGAGAPDLRSAISRAYYGAYHLAVELLKASGLNPPREHGEVQRMLARSGDDHARMASHLLSDLQSRRVKADYVLEFAAAESSVYAVQSVEMAKEIETLLQRADLSRK